MKILYLIDGYNLLFAHFDSPHSLKELRNSLIETLQKEFAKKKLRGMIVFDGKHLREEESGLSYPSPLIIAFAPKGQNADSYIVEKIETSPSSHNITVITDDKKLVEHVRGLGAKRMSNSSFLKWLYKKGPDVSPKKEKDSQAEIKRLKNIFEKRLSDEGFL